MRYFYARVSTKDQNLDRQMETANTLDVDRIFADKQSGKSFERVEYQRMKRLLKAGDEVYVKELDRLGRNKEMVKDEIRWFNEHGVKFHSLDVPTTMIDYQGQEWVGQMVNNILIEVLGAMAEQERKKILQRQKEGFAAMPVVNGRKWSKKTGRPCGRPEIEISDFQKIFSEQKMGLLTVDECCARLGISRSTWYNRVKAV